MLPRLQAEEQLATIDAVGLGMGAFQPDDAREMLDRLRSLAGCDGGVDVDAAPAQPKLQPSARQLGDVGIGYRIVPPTGGGNG